MSFLEVQPESTGVDKVKARPDEFEDVNDLATRLANELNDFQGKVQRTMESAGTNMEGLSHQALVRITEKADKSIAELVDRYNATLARFAEQMHSGEMIVKGRNVYEDIRQAEGRFNQELEAAVKRVVGHALQADNPEPTKAQEVLLVPAPISEEPSSIQRTARPAMPHLWTQEQGVLDALGNEMPGIFGEDVIASADQERPLNP